MLKWVFGADTKPFQQGLSSMRGQVEGFSKSAGAMMLKAFGFAALVAGARSFFTEMDRVAKLAARFGESTDTIQRVGHAASLAGSDIEGVARAMTLVTRNAVEAAQSGGSVAKAFDSLGINAREFADMSLDQKVLALSRAYSQGGSNAEKMNAIIKVLGKSGADLIPLLRAGPEELAKTLDAAAVVHGASIKAIEAFNDAMTSSGQVLKSWAGDAILAFMRVGDAQATLMMKVFASMKALRDITLGGLGSDEVLRNLKGDMATIDAVAKKREREREGAGSNRDDAGETGDGEASGMTNAEKLAEEIARIEEDARMSQLALAEKILAIQEKMRDLAGEYFDAATDEDQLKARRKMLELEGQIAGVRKEQADEAKRADEEKQRINDQATDRAIAAREAEAEIDREMAMDKMSDAEKIALLEKEQKSLMADARLMEEQGDPAGAAESRVKAKRKQQEIDNINDAAKPQAATPTIIAEDIKRAGGGGFANFGAKIDPQKEAVNELKSIRASLASIDAKTRGAGPPPPSDL